MPRLIAPTRNRRAARVGGLQTSSLATGLAESRSTAGHLQTRTSHVQLTPRGKFFDAPCVKLRDVISF